MSRTATILLLTEDYAERLSALYEAAEEALNDETPLLLTEAPPYEALKAEYDALKAEAEEAGTRVVLRAIGRKLWREMKAKHPPRTEGDPDVIKQDRLAGVNTDDIEDDLVYASLVEPDLKSRDAYDEWASEMTEGDFQTVLQRAWSLVNVSLIDPKSLPASPMRSSAAS
jgi:hypothetical protein